MTYYHPKHYKEMRAKRRKLQAASEGSEDLRSNKPQAYQINYDDFCKGDEEEASSSKPQAPSVKHQASSSKPKRSDQKIPEPRSTNQQ